jgi:hypothetical protein
MVATWFILLMVMVSCSCCATTDLSSGVSAALKRFILKKLIHITSYCLRNLRKALLEIPPLTSLCGYGILASYSSKLSLMTRVVLVMHVSSSLVVSFGFMAKFDNPSSLGIRPSVCLGQILKSSDEICCRNGVLALGTKEFWYFVLLHPEVEVRGPVASTWCGGDIRLGRGVTSAVVVSIEIDVVLVVVIVVVFWGQVDIVTSSSGHFCRAKALNSLIKTPVVFQILVVVFGFP